MSEKISLDSSELVCIVIIYICLSKHENDLVLMILRCYYYLKYNRLILNRKRFLYEYNNNFKQKRVNAYALKKKEKRARSL